nr:hypothetical protein [Tanacetum cinerariifolium]
SRGRPGCRPQGAWRRPGDSAGAGRWRAGRGLRWHATGVPVVLARAEEHHSGQGQLRPGRRPRRAGQPHLRDQAGLDPEHDLDIVDMPPGNMNAALERGIVDAAFTWEPFISQALARGSAKVLLDVNQAAPKYPWYVVIALPKTLQERP